MQFHAVRHCRKRVHAWDCCCPELYLCFLRHCMFIVDVLQMFSCTGRCRTIPTIIAPLPFAYKCMIPLCEQSQCSTQNASILMSHRLHIGFTRHVSMLLAHSRCRMAIEASEQVARSHGVGSSRWSYIAWKLMLSAFVASFK